MDSDNPNLGKIVSYHSDCLREVCEDMGELENRNKEFIQQAFVMKKIQDEHREDCLTSIRAINGQGREICDLKAKFKVLLFAVSSIIFFGLGMVLYKVFGG